MFEQMWRQHDIAIFAALALLYAYDHALAVDVGNLQRDYLGGAQTCPIGYAQRRLVFEPGRCIEEPRNLLRTQHYGELPRFVNERRVLDDVVSLERHPEKEPQRRDGVIENRRSCAVRSQLQLKAPYILQACRIGRSTEKCGEILDGADVALLGLRR